MAVVPMRNVMLADKSAVGNSQIDFTQNNEEKMQNVLRDADLDQTTYSVELLKLRWLDIMREAGNDAFVWAIGVVQATC
jgi:hypothetical protein